MLNKNLLNDVSVVIATLGGDFLYNTIEKMNEGTIVPEEILICIPIEYSERVKGLNFSNVEIIKTVCKGQVAQRAVGFSMAKSSFVLQMDDDIYLRKNCLEELLKVVQSCGKIAVGPKLYDRQSGEYHSFLLPSGQKLSLFERLFYFVINGKNGFEPGKIGKSGINIGLPEIPGTWENIDWLSGGCVMHRKENLILANYYPVKGKAYAEDLFHSNLLRINGIKLIRTGNASCDVDFSSSKSSFLGFFKGNFNHLIPMRIFVKSINGSQVRLHLFVVMNILRICYRKLFKFFGRKDA
jgi:GT2 family glycosyltransferase